MYVEVFLVGLLAAISPGPDFVVVMKNSLNFGARAGVATALGISLALVIHVTYTVLGFALILQKSPVLFQLIQVVGATYLTWLGINAIRLNSDGPAISGNDVQAANGKRFKAAFFDGFFCNALNPKAALFFLSIFSQFLTPQTPEWVRWIYGLENVLAVGLWFIFLSNVIAMEKFQEFYRGSIRWFNFVLGCALLYFAGRIFIGVLF